jgi:hypothetical protein
MFLASKNKVLSTGHSTTDVVNPAQGTNADRKAGAVLPAAQESNHLQWLGCTMRWEDQRSIRATPALKEFTTSKSVIAEMGVKRSPHKINKML